MALSLEQLPLQDDEYALQGLVLGNDDRVRDIFVTDLNLGNAELQTQDVDNPQGDNTHMGRDYLRGPTWTFRLVTDTDNEVEALAVYNRLAAVWRNREIMRTPGLTVPLTYRTAGRTRRVYGRPRNFSIVDRSSQDQGLIEVLAEFKTADALHYEETEQTLTITLIPSQEGGLTDPLTDPLTSTGTPPRAGLVNLTGDGETPFTVTFKGPGANLSVSQPGVWKVGIRGALDTNDTVVVDTRLATVHRNGAPVGGLLTHDTFLADARLQPGAQEIVFSGTSETGTAQAILAWRPATDGF